MPAFAKKTEKIELIDILKSVHAGLFVLFGSHIIHLLRKSWYYYNYYYCYYYYYYYY